MSDSCIIDRWLYKHKLWLSFIAKLLLIWGVIDASLVLVKHMVLNKPWPNSFISLANFIGIGEVVGTIALAVFAWMAYQYGYLQQKKDAAKWDKSFKVIESALFQMSCICTESLKMSFIKSKLEECGMKPECRPHDLREALETLNSLITDNAISQQDTFKKARIEIMNSVQEFSTLSVLGVPLDEIQDASKYIRLLISSLNSYEQVIRDAYSLLGQVQKSVSDNDTSIYSENIRKFYDLNFDIFSNEDFSLSYDSFVVLATKMLDPQKWYDSYLIYSGMETEFIANVPTKDAIYKTKDGKYFQVINGGINYNFRLISVNNQPNLKNNQLIQNVTIRLFFKGYVPKVLL